MMYFGIFHHRVRYTDLFIFVKILVSIVFTGIFFLAFLLVNGINNSLALVFEFVSIATLLIISSKFFAEYFYQIYLTTKKYNPLNSFIYGAGEAGIKLYQTLRNAENITILGFIDDSVEVNKKLIYGKPVFSFQQFKNKVLDFDVHQIFFAIPSLSSEKKLKIFSNLSTLNIRVLSVPSISELIKGSDISSLKDIRPTDLLPRREIIEDISLIKTSIKNKNILISGAGGTIGSAIAIKSISSKVSKLVLIERSEFALYQLEQEIIKMKANHQFQCKFILGDVIDKVFMTNIIKREEIDIIYHAAAYKHVPLVELNPFRGVLNNVIGTLNIAQAAAENNINRFILISTDKAVRPTNVMGASKRLAELVIAAIGKTKNKTIFTMVRFGNVLGSSGSVIPLFKSQILSGGPVTITHKDINRYFMSIEEAVSLVIQAGSLAHGGEVFLLNMGEPVKIDRLARQMISLSGFKVKDKNNPNGIDIIYSGLRPGEKLYEELLIDSEAKKTSHPDIFMAKEKNNIHADFLNEIERLSDILIAEDQEKLQALFKKYVEGYHTSTKETIN